ncbi:MAG TPA: KTSC domain-containing protein [Anaerolineae bacterium]
MIPIIEDERWHFDVELAPVESDVIRAMRYDRTQHLLEIVFKNGRVYQYVSVPAEVYANLSRAGSKGRYFTKYIRNIYPYWRLHRVPRRKKTG